MYMVGGQCAIELAWEAIRFVAGSNLFGAPGLCLSLYQLAYCMRMNTLLQTSYSIAFSYLAGSTFLILYLLSRVYSAVMVIIVSPRLVGRVGGVRLWGF